MRIVICKHSRVTQPLRFASTNSLTVLVVSIFSARPGPNSVKSVAPVTAAAEGVAIEVEEEEAAAAFGGGLGADV